MIAFDTNVLLPAVDRSSRFHAKAASFLHALQDDEAVVISELVLMELYGLLRNPVVLSKPASALDAVAVCQRFRSHPRWQLVGLPPDGRVFHDELWRRLGDHSTPRRRVYDLRLGLSLAMQGVTRFATANVRDFRDIGFQEVFNPLG